MERIIFRNLDPSEGIREAVSEGLSTLKKKFPQLRSGDIRFAFECRNSPSQAGPDRYDVVMDVMGTPWGHLHLKKSSENPYKGLELALDRFEEIIGRHNRKLNHRRKSGVRRAS